MKKSLFFLGMAAIMMAGCSSDDYLGEVHPSTNQKNGAILFSGLNPSMTRAPQSGETAATTLGKQFIVYGTKHLTGAEAANASNDVVVFDNYRVQWNVNTGEADNSDGWGYVGLKNYPTNADQFIKYWDPAVTAANGYTFYAFSALESDLTSKNVEVTKTTTGTTVYDKGYTMTVKNGASIKNIFFADRKAAVNRDGNNAVEFTFRNFSAKIRLGMYETVPGYTVKIDKFYYDDDATAAVTDFTAMEKEATDTYVSLPYADPATGDVEFTVSYYDNTVAAIENNAKVKTSAQNTYNLKLGSDITTATKIGTEATAPTFDNTTYTYVCPNSENTTDLLLKVDYTLTAEDASGEQISIKGATVRVPAKYAQWKNNYAYTYLFKITDKSSEQLYPITFDAVVEDAFYTQEVVSTSNENNVTTYTNGTDVTTTGEYKAGEDVYFATIDDAGVLQAVTIGNYATDGNVAVYKIVPVSGGIEVTEDNVWKWLNGKVADTAFTSVTQEADANMSLVQTVPLKDGTNLDFGSANILKWTNTTAGTYAYIRTISAKTATADGKYDIKVVVVK